MRLTVRDGRHPLCQRLQNRRSTPYGVGFERFSSREHEHNQRTGQVFAEQGRCDNGNASQQIRAELTTKKLHHQIEDEGETTQHQSGSQWKVVQRKAVNLAWRPYAETEQKGKSDCRDRESRDQLSFAVGTRHYVL